MSDMSVLEMRGLGKDYGKLTAVRALDLDVAEAEILGVLGPNGAGKTTAISMVAGVITPSRGTAVVAGHDIRREPFAARRQLGLVPQDNAIYLDLTARQNLRFFGSAYGLGAGLLDERIDWALDVAGLRERADDAVSRFSGGMKRRLNLVAGLLHRPRLLILDEPTVGVDPQSRNHIFETIRELRREHGVSIVYTSHYIEEVEALCDRVAIIDHGELAALDRVSTLLDSHGVREVEMQVQGDVAAALAAMSAVSGIGPVERDGDRLRLSRAASLGPVVRAIESAGAELIAVRTVEPDLERVFLALTGHSLRDDGE
jgi:ABC-2 type transport system ATP-binding protein